MFHSSQPIGVMDSGVGGLTVVRELQRLCPEEDIVYFGDSANCPYGNRDQADIADLSRRMLRFLEEREVKAVAIACNTISTIVETLRTGFDFPIIGIVAPTAEAVARSGIGAVGVFATEFTILTKNYDKLIHQLAPSVEVYGKGSPNLAMLVDRGDFDIPAIEAEIRARLGALLADHPLDRVILGCTHFPIVTDVFQRCFPAVEFLNPALEQARAVVSLLDREDLRNRESLRNPPGRSSLKIFTSGDPAVFASIAKRLALRGPDELSRVALNVSQ